MTIPSFLQSDKIIKKSKQKHIKFLVLEKKFLKEKKISKIKKKVYFYTIKEKKLFDQFSNRNLIFENL